MKQVYELRIDAEVIGVFSSEDKTVKAMKVYIEYLKTNNGLEAKDIPQKLNRHSVIEMSNGWVLYIFQRELFQTIKNFKRYLGLC